MFKSSAFKHADPHVRERATAVRASLWSAILQLDTLTKELPELAELRPELRAMVERIDEASKPQVLAAA